jgi:prepilin-type N-terminal cleavage/methylation domain-containing protein
MKGFTTIELLLVIAIVAIFAGMSLFFSMDSLRGYQIQSQKEEVLNLLQVARQKSMSNISEKAFGVRLESNKAILFESPFVLNAASNYVVNLSGDVSISSAGLPYEVVFSRLSGTTNSTSFKIQNSASTVLTISINEHGGMDWAN